MKIQTTRFGELEVKKSDVLHFVEGILGFEHLKKFFIVDPGDNTLILWLQSTEDAKVAFPIMEPAIFRPGHSINLLPSEIRGMELVQLTDARIYCILTIPQDITKMSANLKAPIVINSKNNTARQVVLQDNKLAVRFEMYKELKKHISSKVSDDTIRTTVQLGHSEAIITIVEDETDEKTTNSPHSDRRPELTN